MDDRRALGATGEAVAAAWYEARGYRVLERNWRCRAGELDLILLAAGDVIVFCEVKTRTSSAFGVPAEAVTATKQARLRRLAAAWLAAHEPRRHGGVRFDVVSVLGPRNVEVYEAAF